MQGVISVSKTSRRIFVHMICITILQEQSLYYAEIRWQSARMEAKWSSEEGVPMSR
jgi:hypothetical protein